MDPSDGGSRGIWHTVVALAIAILIMPMRVLVLLFVAMPMRVLVFLFVAMPMRVLVFLFVAMPVAMTVRPRRSSVVAKNHTEHLQH
jgi:membrane protein implicated in regulation of membrane protease activity